ncbi:hypothetical protein FQR65_LT02477 [Abscondita terminalis]|nr:hypothetical protein FQR65_LT02477 [Abscondita terminalis]
MFDYFTGRLKENMGRRERKRTTKKKSLTHAIHLDCDPIFIKLKQWMTTYKWQTENKLRIALFSNTGRGVVSLKTLKVGDTLVQVPYDLMITFTTLQTLFVQSVLTSYSLLQMQDLLSVFIILERHKGASSQWKPYIDSLPDDTPDLPWLSHSHEINALPNKLQVALIKRRESFELSWERLKKSINSNWKCECCQIPGNRVITLNSFTWAYVMVNTRAVYIDPNIVRELSTESLKHVLSDEPCMALCPYLDMFNHSNKAKNEVNLVKINGKWVYELTTLSGSIKHREVFISYGSHDNFKLLCEYGFFIPNNELDLVRLDFDEVLKISEIKLNQKQYRFIKMRKFDESLYVDRSGMSFNLKAVFFVMLNPSLTDWCFRIFSDYLKDDLVQMDELLKNILKWESLQIESVLKSSGHGFYSENFKLIVKYLNYQLNVINELIVKGIS